MSTIAFGLPFEEIRRRIESRITIEDRGYRTPCWISDRAGGGSKGEYTKIGFTSAGGAQEVWYTHRLAYVVYVDPIPEGRVVDHRCEQPKCCNPLHLAAVAQRENVLRGSGLPSRELAQAACIHGHEFTATNTYIDRRGRRHCRACSRIRARAARQRRAA